MDLGCRGAWAAQSVKRSALDFSSGHILWFVRSSPVSGSALTTQVLLGILSRPFSLPFPSPLSLFLSLCLKINKKKPKLQKISSECLRGSVGWASDFSSGHDLLVCEFESHVGLCAASSEPGGCFRFCVSLSLSVPPPHSCSVSHKHKQALKN